MNDSIKRMPAQAFSVKNTKRVNVLYAPASVSIAYNPTSNSTQPQIHQFNSIWDTGASGTVITNNVVNKCNLKPISMAQVHTANGVRNTNVYLVNIYLPNRVMVQNVKVTEGEINGADILIGMDIIGMGDFAVTNNNNETLFSFRIPSSEHIDFVKNSPQSQNVVHAAGTSRNALCPCGSGKKYKKCCGMFAS